MSGSIGGASLRQVGWIPAAAKWQLKNHDENGGIFMEKDNAGSIPSEIERLSKDQKLW